MVTIYYPNWIPINGLRKFESVEDACAYGLAVLHELHTYLVGTNYEIAAVICNHKVYYPSLAVPVPGTEDTEVR